MFNWKKIKSIQIAFTLWTKVCSQLWRSDTCYHYHPKSIAHSQKQIHINHKPISDYIKEKGSLKNLYHVNSDVHIVKHTFFSCLLIDIGSLECRTTEWVLVVWVNVGLWRISPCNWVIPVEFGFLKSLSLGNPPLEFLSWTLLVFALYGSLSCVYVVSSPCAQMVVSQGSILAFQFVYDHSLYCLREKWSRLHCCIQTLPGGHLYV